jgi:hypothetical protein
MRDTGRGKNGSQVVKRLLFNFAAIVSLMLSVATVVLWVRSYNNQDFFALNRPGYLFYIHSHSGHLIVEYATPTEMQRPGFSWWTSQWNFHHYGKPVAEHHFGGFAIYRSRGRESGMDDLPYRESFDSRSLEFPCWAAFLILLSCHSYTYPSARILRRSLSNRCPFCGYSLTGNVSGVCPECGTPVAKKTGAKS